MLFVLWRRQNAPPGGLMRYLLFLSLTLFACALPAADDFKVIKLEQDVRNLERQVQELSRQLDELKSQLGRAGDRQISSSRTVAPAAATSTAWLNVSNWDRLRTGMSELEVIGALGPPTSMRQDGEIRVLLYAMEIGSSGFLSGSVSLRERALVEVSKPVLK
jgi:hypothetical protein